MIIHMLMTEEEPKKKAQTSAKEKRSRAVQRKELSITSLLVKVQSPGRKSEPSIRENEPVVRECLISRKNQMKPLSLIQNCPQMRDMLI